MAKNPIRTVTHERGKVLSEVLRSDSGDRSYSDCTFLNSQAAAHAIGQVMKSGAGGALEPITAAADTPVGVLTYEADARGATDVEGYILDTDAELRGAGVVYFTGISDADKAVVDTKLAALGLKVRGSN